MNVMLLCAGEGTRLRPFTETTPKPAIPFLGVPLAAYQLAFLDRISIDRLVVNTYHLPDQIKKLFKEMRPQWNDIQLTSEAGKLLGPGGGIHNAFKHLKGRGDFIVMNGDEVILPHQMGLIEEMISFHKWHKGIATLMTMDYPGVGTKFGGAWLAEGSKIQCFSKTPPGSHAPRGLHFIGPMILSEKIAKYFKSEIDVENILYDTLTGAMNDGQEVHSFECKTEWFETGNPTDFLHATEFCLDALSKPEKERPYWQEYLMQTIRLYGDNQFVLEKDWDRLPELQSLLARIKKGL